MNGTQKYNVAVQDIPLSISLEGAYLPESLDLVAM
jgi:hypothetical protein